MILAILVALLVLGLAVALLIYRLCLLVFGACYEVLFHRSPSLGALRIFAAGFTLVSFIGLPIIVWSRSQIDIYMNLIPPQLQIAELFYHDEQSDLREGCGVAIFRLSGATMRQVNQAGLVFLNSERVGRGYDESRS